MWIILVSVFISLSLVMSLLLCVCWKDKTPKDEWLGVDGMVTQKNPDENVNHLPSAATCINGLRNVENDKKNTISTRRSLPDIPSELTPGVTWEVNGDNSSEHYATLGQYQASTVKGTNVHPSISQHSSISQADESFSPYERVKYDKIKSKKEHPYAQVQPAASRPPLYEENAEERAVLLRGDGPGTSTIQTTPIRSRRSSTQNEPTVDIPAASAVAGGIAASYELPYMTPPINFSGDSQDSSKGYTSISVREPLANILAQTNSNLPKQKRKLDVHYSTVSDDSDDVYTTIPDPNNPIYTSESETYARIPPLPITVEAEVNVPPPERDEVDLLYEPPHQPLPPNVDSFKHVTSHSHSHSRQASSSSSSANFGSPKPEKRQANSPLPPPPTNIDFHGDKLQVKRNLDDLYAKVQKNRKDDGINDLPEGFCEERSEHNYETLKKSSTTNSDFGYEKIRGGHDCEPGYASINGPDSLAGLEPGYEVLKDEARNYEELRHTDVLGVGYSVVNKKKKKINNYEQILPSTSGFLDPNYAATKSSGSESDPNYESVNNPRSDPNYESVCDLEAFYEENDKQAGGDYQKIKCDVSESSNSASRTAEESDPPYERLKDSCDTPAYDKIGGSNGSGGSTNDIEPIQNEEADMALNNIHDENVVVQV
ncbi:hypothetical protein ABEB36_012518 [Hypothenemus hampei]|uniref:Uncharacterized protein n=1 Tax=Hypothenemus hampei TaxID=57062 RepID=A0ABD1EBH4_HYPHA